jgi:RHS repeat-associated protein
MHFTGHERDSHGEGEMDNSDYMHARYYSPHWRRFMSVDPVVQVERAMIKPQSWNRYSYVGNQPLKYTDPSGRVVQLSEACSDNENVCLDLQSLRRSVPPGARVFIQAATTKDGRTVLNARLLNAGRNSTSSKNFLGLRQLANSPATVEFSTTAASFTVRSGGVVEQETFQPPSPEMTFFGIFLTPAESASGNPQVFVNPFLNQVDSAGTTGHELIGHALRYVLGLPYQHDPVWDDTLGHFLDRGNAAAAIRRAQREAEANATQR